MNFPKVPGQETVINVQVGKKQPPPAIPEQGFYIDLDYMFGDADGDTTETTGPFPVDRVDLLIEFLNVLEAMLATYPNGKSGYDDYFDVPGYNEWFDYTNVSGMPDANIRKRLQCEAVSIPDGSDLAAEFTGYTVYYQDGLRLDRYDVNVTKI